MIERKLILKSLCCCVLGVSIVTICIQPIQINIEPPIPQEEVVIVETNNTNTEINEAEEAAKQVEQEIQQQEQIKAEKENIRLASRGGLIHDYPFSPKYDLRKKSGLSAADMDRILEDTGLSGLGQAYIDSENKHGSHALFMAAISILESAWGKSQLAKIKNNLFGFGAYDGNVSKAIRFSSKSQCIDYVSKYISEEYLQEDGKHFSGFTIRDVGKKYSSNSAWAYEVAEIMNILLDKIKEE
jgi:beta-N-acetylglucosaminidase